MRVQLPPPAAFWVPIEKPFWDEEGTNLASTPNAVHRFVFAPRERGLSFYVTFVLDQSGETRVRDVGAVVVLRSDGRQKVERIRRGRTRSLAEPQFLVPKGFAAAKLAEICTVVLHSSYTDKIPHFICNKNNQIQKFNHSLRMTILKGRFLIKLHGTPIRHSLMPGV
jgi:hypothetical protein